MHLCVNLLYSEEIIILVKFALTRIHRFYFQSNLLMCLCALLLLEYYT